MLRNTSGAGEVTRFQDPGTTTYTYYWPTGSGLFTSSDGVSWTKNTSLPTNFASYASVVKIGDAYYLSSYNLGLFRSTDGKTWSNVIPSTSAAIFFSTPYRISGTSPIFASSESKGLWYSTDDGGTWTQVNASGVSGNLPSDVKLRKPFVKIGDTYYLTTINHGLWKTNSIINGGTWTQVTVGSTTTNLDIRSEVTKIGDTYYLDTYKNGLYTSDNGTTWTKNQTIPDNINAFWGVKEINGTYYLASDAGGLFTSKTGTTWSRVGSSFFDNRNILGFRRPPVFLNNTYYIGSNQDGLWSSSDGQTWTPTNLTRNATLAYSNFRVYSNPSLVGGKLYLPTLGQGLWSLT